MTKEREDTQQADVVTECQDRVFILEKLEPRFHKSPIMSWWATDYTGKVNIRDGFFPSSQIIRWPFAHW